MKTKKGPRFDRLLRLARFLEKLPKNRFYYGRWSDSTTRDRFLLLRAATRGDERSCGTTGCALGWAPSIPSFRRDGLFLDRNGIPALIERDFGGSAIMVGAKFFQIAPEESRFLFVPNETLDDGRDDNFLDSPGSRATPKQVAKHIRRFVAWKRASIHATKQREQQEDSP